MRSGWQREPHGASGESAAACARARRSRPTGGDQPSASSGCCRCRAGRGPARRRCPGRRCPRGRSRSWAGRHDAPARLDEQLHVADVHQRVGALAEHQQHGAALLEHHVGAPAHEIGADPVGDPAGCPALAGTTTRASKRADPDAKGPSCRRGCRPGSHRPWGRCRPRRQHSRPNFVKTTRVSTPSSRPGRPGSRGGDARRARPKHQRRRRRASSQPSLGPMVPDTMLATGGNICSPCTSTKPTPRIFSSKEPRVSKASMEPAR